MSSATPDLADLLRLITESAIGDLRVCMPGQVSAIYADSANRGQYVDVRPSLRVVLPTDEDSETPEPFVEEELPVIPRVPVAFPQGGGFSISWPLAVGDFVTLVFADRNLDLWLATAAKASQATSSTGDLGTHPLDGAIALPLGPAPQANLLVTPSATELVIGHEGGLGIRIGSTIIALGGAGLTDWIALASLVNDRLTAISGNFTTLKNAVTAALTTIDASAAGTTTVATFTGSTSGVPSSYPSVASSVIKAK
jgi:hypothetical protein